MLADRPVIASIAFGGPAELLRSGNPIQGESEQETSMAGPEPDKSYMMPAIVGYKPTGEGTWYRDVAGMSVTYVTHARAVERLLPDGFTVGAGPEPEPLVTVSYSRNRRIDWLAGGSYNIVGVNVAATYHGEEETVEGGYCVILWEDLTEPILSGREQTGIPKVYADITDFLPTENGVRARASLRGHPIVELEVHDLEALPEAGVREFEARSRGGNWMGYKYIPRIGEPGADVAYATVFPSRSEYEKVEAGAGSVRFFSSTFTDNPTQFQVVNLLCELEPLEYRAAFRTQGRNQLLPGKARALR